MAYAVRGLDPAPFASLFALPADRLAAHRAVRVRAAANAGYPCRVSLRDAAEGEELMLIHHVHHDVETPYRSAFAIYVRRDADQAALYVDECPPVFTGRPIALRGYDGNSMLVAAQLALPGEADERIRQLLEAGGTAYIDAHNAAHGCFAARIERHG